MIEMTSDTYQQLAAQIIPKGLNPLEMGRHAILGLVSRYTAFKGNSDLLDGLYTKVILAINKQERERVEARHKVSGLLPRHYHTLQYHIYRTGSCPKRRGDSVSKWRVESAHATGNVEITRYSR